MRSENHPTYYEVGRLNGDPLYWSPAEGYAIEQDFENLIPVRNISNAEFFTDYEMWEKIEKAIRNSHGRLRKAMDEALKKEIKAIEEDMAWAEACEEEKKSSLYAANQNLLKEG